MTLLLATLLASAGGAWWGLRRSVWGISAGAISMALVAVALIAAARSLPIPGPPPTPFILWAAGGSYAWASPDRDAPPRTYVWRIPPDMARDLRKGIPLAVADGDEERQGEGREPGPGEYRWTPLQPENDGKEQL